MAESLVIAKKERAVLRESINKFINKIEAILKEGEPDIFYLEEVVEQLCVAEIELTRADGEIKKMVQEAQLDTELQGAREFKEKITSWRFRANRKIKELDKKKTQDDSFSKRENPLKENVNIKLPKLNIAKFSGDFVEWLSFWSAFETTIHNNDTLDPVDKFNYLKSLLAPSPLKSIDGFCVTAENYLKAVDILKGRYGNKDMLISVHTNKLLNLTPLRHSNDTKSFRKLFDEIQTNIRSLESLNISLDSYGSLLSPILFKLLPRDLVLEFNKTHDDSINVQDLISFLHKQLISREKMYASSPNEINEKSTQNNYGAQSFRKNPSFPPRVNKFNSQSNKFDSPNRKLPSASDLLVQSENETTCGFCFGRHQTNKCFSTRNLPFEKRLDLLRKRGLCYRCLTHGHIGKYCVSNDLCGICNSRHAQIMCNKEINSKGKSTNSESSDVTMLSNQDLISNVYLQTLIVEIRNDNQSSEFIRIIIDTGSHNSYITRYAANKLKLRKIRSETIRHGLFGGVEKTSKHNRYEFTISNLDHSFRFKIQALDEGKICSGVNLCRDNEMIKILEKRGIHRTDVRENNRLCLYENNPEEVHILIGADMAAKLFTDNIKHFPDLGLTAFETKLGWTILGKTEGNGNDSESSLSVLSLSLFTSNASLAQLWNLDTLGITSEDYKNKDDLARETYNHFLETVKRDESGRYEVTLPWTVDNSILASNRVLAEKHLHKTEQKLNKTNKRIAYEEIFNLWKDSNIIEEISDDKENKVHFLPHRPVIKENSETTKIRPVFNASAHTANSPLNDCLTKGPNLIEIIPSILNRFRKYKIGISSDIEKAFLQIKITEKDRDFLRFLWFDSKHNLKVYRHCRVVFGLTSSPFLLMGTLNHLLSQVPEQWENTARILKDSFYIDNSIISLKSIADTEKFITESQCILSSAHFNLRCWRSNLPQAMIDVSEENTKLAPVLGLVWDLEQDRLMCKIEEKIETKDPLTKRKILSVTQKIFDPIGFSAPSTLIPKLILQETWKQKLKWDEELPENLRKQFETWLKQINFLQEIQVPRWLNVSPENENRISLHTFSDASRQAYATCVYLRCQTQEGVKVQLVNARSRVAPIKEFTIPRLELLACLIGARLAKSVTDDLKLKPEKTTFWSDSSTALGWIRREQTWGTFVHNRVLEIRSLTQVEDWRHVPGNLNPADLPSRGCSFEQLKKSRWWEGPDWLYLSEDQWPQPEEYPDEKVINQEKKKTILTLLDNEDTEVHRFYRYFSSYRKNVRMIAFIYRFYNNTRKKERISSPNISVDEFEKAEKILLRLVQKESFSGSTDPKLRALRPLEDKNGLLRAKTNIICRQDKEDFRYPIILPSKHPVVQKLIFEKHLENHHAGVSILMAQLREKFWILKSRKYIRNVIRQCVKCQRFQTPRTEVEPGIPPEDRIRDAAIFEVVGVDLAGPLYLADGSKVWIALFTCAVYRAVHLELITSLSAECFMQSLRRFIARRGRPYIIYSDNGKNFVGTSRALSSVDWEAIRALASIQKIRWKFNPPAAPWWGGWWERLVRMVKEILRKVLGRASLNYEELSTILCDCEQIINSRPLTYISEDNRDPEPLTPLMFLQELPTSSVPDIDTLDSQDLNRRAKYRQRIRNDLRKRFRTEYLGQLRQQSMKKNSKPLQIGDIVLLEDTNKRRLHWPLAKIIDIFPGKDKIARFSKIQTENGIFLRPFQRLFPLEVDAASDSPSDNLIQQKVNFNVHNEQRKITPEIDQTRISVEKSQPSDRDISPVVTRRGRLVKPPLRFRSGLLNC